MRIHTETVFSGDIYDAARVARVTVERAGLHNSRSRDHAWDIALTGESKRRPNFGKYPGEYAATWDQWGVFISALFKKDPDLTIPQAYATVEDFHRQTANRFQDGWPADAHGDHTFVYDETLGYQKCTKCSATSRR